ncbi:MAG: hypothetical protein J3R72DRAFT_157559 [Linnemannia gamsii]|nr:MAG: hypothetical protein J3R72DRAFT_157559 [Linnemannia gamsii]
MDDLDMDEDFDFGNLTLGEFPRDSTSQSSEVLHLSDSLSAATLSDQQAQAQAQTQAVSATSTGSSTSITTVTTPTSEGEPTPDNGPWAKLPSASEEINPYLPGVTAQKLDAMAMDPHHVFKSAPPQSSSSSSFSISIPPEDSQAQQHQQRKSQKDKDATQDGDDGSSGKDTIPAWMLADPELKPTTHLGWTTTTTTTTTTGTSQDEDNSLGWGDVGIFGASGYSGADLSTTVDSNAIFGFSSYPTYESLSIANAIAEEQHRKHTILASGGTYDPFSSSSSSSSGEGGHSRMKEGGFARFGNTVRGDGQIAPVFGRRPSLVALSSSGSGSGATTTTTTTMTTSTSDEHDFTWDNKDQRKGLAGSQNQQQQQQWQTWRSNAPPQQSGQGQQLLDLDQSMDEDLEEEDDPFDELSPQIKPTPGFAPAQYKH